MENMKTKNILFIISLVILISLFIYDNVFAANTYTFDTYSDGTRLYDVIDWTEKSYSGDNQSKISSDLYSSSPNSLNQIKSSLVCSTLSEVSLEGSIELDYYISSGSGTWTIGAFSSDLNNTDFRIIFRDNGDVGVGSTYSDDFTGKSQGSWYHVKIEYRDFTEDVRVCFGSVCGDWHPKSHNEYFNQLCLDTSTDPDDNVYSDNIYLSSASSPVPDNLSFTTPTDGSYLSIGDYEFSGECLTNGENQLYISNGMYWDYPDDESDFNIDCIDYGWSATSTIYHGSLRSKYIFDKDYLISKNSTTTTYVVYTGIDSSYNYGLSIIYPDQTSSNFFEVAYSNDFPFKFSYVIPDKSLRDTTIFRLSTCSSSFDNCSILMNNSLSFLDPDLKGIETSGIVSTTTMKYYSATLIDTDTDTIEYKLYFRVLGSSSETVPQPVSPTETDLGFWGNTFRNLFVPTQSSLFLYTEIIPEQLSSKAPFSFFYDIRDSILGLDIGKTDFELEFDISDISGTETKMKFIDTGNSSMKSILDEVRPLFGVALYIFMFYSIIGVLIDLKL